MLATYVIYKTSARSYCKHFLVARCRHYPPKTVCSRASAFTNCFVKPARVTLPKRFVCAGFQMHPAKSA